MHFVVIFIVFGATSHHFLFMLEWRESGSHFEIYFSQWNSSTEVAEFGSGSSSSSSSRVREIIQQSLFSSAVIIMFASVVFIFIVVMGLFSL